MRRLLSVLLVAGLSLLAAPAIAEDPPEDPPGGERVCDPDDPEGYQQLVDLTFPVSGDVQRGHFSDDYHQERGGGVRRHQATDIVGEKLQGIHAAMEGTVVSAPMVKPSYGYIIRIEHPDGLSTSYVHLNDDTPGTSDASAGPEWAYAPGIEQGAWVERGQWIGYLGDSGNAKGVVPHLHFEIRLPEALDDPCLDDETYRHKDRINPYPSLVDAFERGDIPDPPEGAPSESPEPHDQVRRLSGDNRIRTAIALSQDRERPARTVVVVPDGSHVEALVSAPLAGLVDAPVLLNGATELHPDVAAEIGRLGAVNAYLIGGPDVLAPRIEDDLEAAGIENMARIHEPDPFRLSAAMATELLTYEGVEPFEQVLIALGEADDPSRAWPDALSASALAAVSKIPILLTRTDELPGPILDLLADLRPEQVTIVGGTAAVSEAVEQAAADAAGAPTERLAGATRFATSTAVADAAIAAGLTAPAVWTATGHAFPDALAAGPAAARAGAPLVLVDGRDPSGAAEVRTWLEQEAGRLESIVVVGGTAAITADVADHLGSILADP